MIQQIFGDGSEYAYAMDINVIYYNNLLII